MHLDFVKIKPYKPSCDETLSEEAYLSFIEDTLRQMIPEEILIQSMHRQGTPQETFISPLEASLPLVSFQVLSYQEKTLKATVLCPADFTQGIGRFFTDILAKSLLPGKLFSFFASKALNFHFVVYPDKAFYLCENCIDLETAENLDAVKKRLDLIEKQTKLTILAVMHARKLVNSKKLSNQERHMLLMENLMGMHVKGAPVNVDDLFSQSYKLLSNAYSEKVESSFAPLSTETAKSDVTLFDHNIFRTIYKEVSFIFEKSQIAHYPIYYLNKLISYCYLFQKRQKHAIMNKQLLKNSLKVLPLVIKEGERPLYKLGILTALVLGEEQPDIQEKALMHSLYHFNTQLCFGNSHIFTTRFLSHKIALIYVEANKPENAPFTPTEISYWKQHFLDHLNAEMKGRITEPYQKAHFFEEQGLFLTLRDTYFKLGVNSLVHSCLSSHPGQQEPVSFFILSTSNIDALYLESSKLSPYEIGAYQKKAIGTSAQGQIVYYYTFKMFASQAHMGDKSAEEHLDKMTTLLKNLFGPLHPFSPYFLKKCPAKLRSLKQALIGQVKEEVLENIYFSLVPKAHRLSLDTDLLKHFILFCAKGVQTLSQTQTLTEIHGHDLFVLTHGVNMKKVRASLRMNPSLSLTEFYTRIEDKQLFGAIIKGQSEEEIKVHARNMVDHTVQLEMSNRLRRKKRQASSLV